MKALARRLLIALCGAALLAGRPLPPASSAQQSAPDALERGFIDPPPETRPHAYWLWLIR